MCVVVCSVCCVCCVFCFVRSPHPPPDLPSTDNPLPDRPPLDRPKFRSFFSPLPPHFCSFCLSLGVFSLNSGGFCEDGDPQICTFGLSGCRVKPRRLRGRRGSTTTRELQTSTFQGPGASNTPKFNGPHPPGPHPFGGPTLATEETVFGPN